MSALLLNGGTDHFEISTLVVLFRLGVLGLMYHITFLLRLTHTLMCQDFVEHNSPHPVAGAQSVDSGWKGAESYMCCSVISTGVQRGLNTNIALYMRGDGYNM